MEFHAVVSVHATVVCSSVVVAASVDGRDRNLVGNDDEPKPSARATTRIVLIIVVCSIMFAKDVGDNSMIQRRRQSGGKNR